MVPELPQRGSKFTRDNIADDDCINVAKRWCKVLCWPYQGSRCEQVWSSLRGKTTWFPTGTTGAIYTFPSHLILPTAAIWLIHDSLPLHRIIRLITAGTLQMRYSKLVIALPIKETKHNKIDTPLGGNNQMQEQVKRIYVLTLYIHMRIRMNLRLWSNDSSSWGQLCFRKQDPELYSHFSYNKSFVSDKRKTYNLGSKNLHVFHTGCRNALVKGQRRTYVWVDPKM